MGLFVGLQLLREFGRGNNPEKQKFLEENGGFKNLLFKPFTAVENKLKSFKNNGRPGQNPENRPDAKNNPNAPKDPKANDKNKPNADQEWSKKNDDEKLSLLKKDSKQFKEFEAKNKADAIKEINETFDKKDLAKLRGIVDKALEGQKFSPQEKLGAFGLANKDEFIFAGKADKDGVFGLYKASDNKTNDTNNPFAKITIGEKGEFKYEALGNKHGKTEDQLKESATKDLEDIRKDPKKYTEFKAKSKEEAISKIDNAFNSGDKAALSGIIDKILQDNLKNRNELSPQIKDVLTMKALGHVDDKSTFGISKPDRNGSITIATNFGDTILNIKGIVENDGSLKSTIKT